jgi:hypothetical protein
MLRRRLAFATSVLLLVAIGVDAQPPVRRATTIEAVRAYAGFFHGQTVAVLGAVTRRGAELTIGTDAGFLKLAGRQMPDEGPAEVRGVFYDIGRLNSDDPRLLQLDLRDYLVRAYGDRWPRPGEELVLSVTRAEPPPAASSATTPSIRTVALAPQRYVDQRITLVGQFRGRNLYGDLPEAPTSERWDFVVRAADAAVWVTGVRPRGKGFAFDTTRRVDTGRWVRVAGTMRYARGLVWMEGTTIELADAPGDEPLEVAVPPPPLPPLQVLFTSPSEGEVDVRLDATIRIQFSRDVDPSSLKDRMQIRYAPAAATTDRPEPQPPGVGLTFNYTPATRGLEIRPTEPLLPLRQVILETLEGVHGPDGAQLAPFTLTFRTGAQ